MSKKSKQLNTPAPSDFRGREHVRNEIPIRPILDEVDWIRATLRSGLESRFNIWTFENEAVPLGDDRIKQLSLLWSIDKELIHLVMPSLKPIASTVHLPKLSAEDMQPQNIRAKMLKQVAKGNMPAELAESICKVSGLTDPLSEDDEVPQEFAVNMYMQDSRIESNRPEDDLYNTFDGDLGDAQREVEESGSRIKKAAEQE